MAAAIKEWRVKLIDKTLFIKGVALEHRALSFLLLSICLMVADSRFSYLEQLRFGLGYAATPVYWVADILYRVSFWIDDVFVSGQTCLKKTSD